MNTKLFYFTYVLSLNQLHFFSVSRPDDIIELAPMSPKTTHQNLDDVKELPEVGESLTGKISEPLIESDTALHKGAQDNCEGNTCFETVQVHSENAESEGNSFSQNTFSVKRRLKVL